MVSPPTRVLLNLAGVIGLVWMGMIFYESITDTGLWHRLGSLLSDDYVEQGPAVTFALCVFTGFIPIAAVTWLVWRVFLRGRPAEKIPAARLRR